MAKIVKGYKQGRGVAFYDIESAPHGETMTMVPKDETVKLIEDGKIGNAKVQWWEGKPIVRVQGNIILVKLEAGTNVEVPTKKREVHRGNSVKEEAPVQASAIPTKVVGKLSKKGKNETIYEATMKMEKDKQRQIASTIDYSKMQTLEDLFNTMASDFRLKNVEQYKTMISKKVKLSTKISSLAQSNLFEIQANMAAYLMNMCYIEVRDTYSKYIG